MIDQDRDGIIGSDDLAAIYNQIGMESRPTCIVRGSIGYRHTTCFKHSYVSILNIQTIARNYFSTRATFFASDSRERTQRKGGKGYSSIFFPSPHVQSLLSLFIHIFVVTHWWAQKNVYNRVHNGRSRSIQTQPRSLILVSIECVYATS